MSMPNRFKFQGQEEQKEFDLNWIQFKWRNHDPAIGRFFNVDPLSEKFYYNSPYAFAENKVISMIELEGLEGLHYMETLDNGSQRNVIEKNVVVLIEKKHDIPKGASDKQKRRLTRKNDRIDQRNSDRIRSVRTELSTFFNGSDGQALGKDGEAVRFQFNISYVEVSDTKGGSDSKLKELAISLGMKGSPAFEGGQDQTVPAAIVTSRFSLTGHNNQFFTMHNPRISGSLAHEVGHTLLTREKEESRPGTGGLMVDPPSVIRPAEVTKMLKDAIKKK